MGGGDQLHSPLSDGAGGGGFLLGAHFVNDDDLRHVVLHRLDHHRVLLSGSCDLHATGVTDGRVRHIAIAGDFVGSVDNYHPFLGLVGQYPGHLTQHGSLTYSRPPQQEDILAGQREVLNHFDGTVYRPSHPAGYAYNLPFAVANGRDAVQSALDTGPVIAAKISHPVNQLVQFLPGDLLLGQWHITKGVSGFGQPPQIKHYLQKVSCIISASKNFGYARGQYI